MTHDAPDRRRVIAGGIALAGSALLPSAAAAQAGLGPGADLLATIRKFLAGLDDGKRKAASFPLNGREWRNWDYFGTDTNIKPGLRLDQMDLAQKQAAWNVLAVLLSPTGIEKTRNVMTLQDVLASQGNMPGQRSSERFSFAVFGTPSETGAWAFRLEGHHLHQSISVRDNRIVSVTPSSFSVNPNRVTSGKHAGLVTLREEESLPRKLYGDLNPKLQGRARISATPMNNIMSYAGRERANAQALGIPASELASAQRDLIWQLVDTYATDYLAPPLADAQRSRVRTGDREAVHFAWYGPNTAERAFGYRVIGPNFVIELGSVDPAAQHIHTVYHDLGNVLGRTG
ncbi:MAG TPA: DUF3500 domain-containing protein [Xanthobacteraceae bacterium]|nr:DUF3500 domain-containing protein [Xanthobacteraceae bacterium]